MSLLRIYPVNSAESYTEMTDFDEIRAYLWKKGVLFERWQAGAQLAKTATPEEVLAAYRPSIEKLKAERGFRTEDVVAIHAGLPNHAEMRQKFLNEHTHTDDEARFFVDGSGLFYINTCAEIIALLCTKGDLVNVPAGTKHWFDMGAEPFFQCVRVFTDPAGWVGHFTGSTITSQYPLRDEYPAFAG